MTRIFLNKDNYMKQTNKLKMIAAMAVNVIGVLFVTSCSNDEFYGFDYNNAEFVDIHHKYIACSLEFEAYVLAMYNYNDEIKASNPFANNKNEYDKNISLPDNHEVMEAFNQMILAFPEYSTLSSIEQMELFKYCEYNSEKLKKYNKNNIVRTKGSNPENKAWNSLNCPPAMGVTKLDQDHYVKNGVHMFLFGDPDIAYLLAYNNIATYNGSDTILKETGGLVFDDSSIYYIDPNATSISMYLVPWNFPYNYKPNYVFHFHITENPIPRDLDSDDLSSCQLFKYLGCPKFRIYNTLHQYEEW